MCCSIRTDMLFHWLIELAWKQDDHRVSSLPLLIKKSLWATATSKYTWCFHPAVAVKWAGEAWIKRHEGGGGALKHAFTAACWTTDIEHKRDKGLHYLRKWLNHQGKPVVTASRGFLLYCKKFCSSVCCRNETSFCPISEENLNLNFVGHDSVS